jgi:protoporphyrinogen oxidase
MVPDESKACVGLEYFCFSGDELWEMADDDLVELAKRELDHLGLVAPEKVERGFVTRVPLAYPMYDPDYASASTRSAAGSRASPTCSRWDAMVCTVTTTRITRC